MKKIMFDLMVSQPVAGSMFHGGGEYTKTVFKKMCDCYSHNIELHVYYNPNLFLDEWIKEYFIKKDIVIHEVQNYDDVESLITHVRPDTLFLGLISGLNIIRKREGMKIIGVYHGFRSLEAPTDSTAYLYEETVKGKIKEKIKGLFRKIYLKNKHADLRKRIEKCDDIIGVSEHSGYAARVFFPEYDRKHIHVFYSPEKYFKPIPNIDSVCEEKVILMLGGNRWVKNVYRGISAIDELYSNNQLLDYTVKVIGGIPSTIKSKINNRERFIECSYMSAEELEKSYKACEIFFYPTLNEGFGYPPQEAMKYGKTCIVSAVNSLIEIYQDSVYYCNPYDINEMKCRLLQAAERKIPETIIQTRLHSISLRQANNLQELCRLIVE